MEANLDLNSLFAALCAEQGKIEVVEHALALIFAEHVDIEINPIRNGHCNVETDDVTV